MYCKNCEKHTGNTFPKKLVMISKNKIKGKSKCAICLTERTFIHEIEDKYGLESSLHENRNFRLTEICEKDRKDHIFIGFRMFLFHGNIIFSELSFKRKPKKVAFVRKCVFLCKYEIFVHGNCVKMKFSVSFCYKNKRIFTSV